TGALQPIEVDPGRDGAAGVVGAVPARAVWARIEHRVHEAADARAVDGVDDELRATARRQVECDLRARVERVGAGGGQGGARAPGGGPRQLAWGWGRRPPAGPRAERVGDRATRLGSVVDVGVRLRAGLAAHHADLPELERPAVRSQIRAVDAEEVARLHALGT